MRDNGRMIEPTVTGVLSIQMATPMRELGKMTRLMEMESISIPTALNTKGLGKKINRMVMELKHGQMEHLTMDIIKKERSMDSVNLDGQMAQFMRVSFQIII